jgi:hypothetical protein
MQFSIFRCTSMVIPVKLRPWQFLQESRSTSVERLAETYDRMMRRPASTGRWRGHNVAHCAQSKMHGQVVDGVYLPSGFCAWAHRCDEVGCVYAALSLPPTHDKVVFVIGPCLMVSFTGNFDRAKSDSTIPAVALDGGSRGRYS